MKKFWEDFKKFITRGNVVDMAVGVAVASAFTAIVTAFTKGFITPLLAIITGSTDLSDLKWIFSQEFDSDGNLVGEIAFLWGDFVQKIIDFLIIALTLFIIMRIWSAVTAHMAKLREKAAAAIHAEEIALQEQKEAEEKAAKEAAEAAEKEAQRLIDEAKQAEIQAERDRLAREEALLTEIRDLLRAQAK